MSQILYLQSQGNGQSCCWTYQPQAGWSTSQPLPPVVASEVPTSRS